MYGSVEVLVTSTMMVVVVTSVVGGRVEVMVDFGLVFVVVVIVDDEEEEEEAEGRSFCGFCGGVAVAFAMHSPHPISKLVQTELMAGL